MRLYTRFAALQLAITVSAVPLNLLGSLSSTVGQLTGTVTGSASSVISGLTGALSSVLPTTPIDSQPLLDDTIADIRKEITEINELFTTFVGLLQAIETSLTPDSIPDAISSAAALLSNATLSNIAVLEGLSVTDLTQDVLGVYLSDINSYNNNNPPAPAQIYLKSRSDAPYSVPEAQLRAAIYIPPVFTYGQKRPILFVPGIGAFGGVNFISNLGKLFADEFDPVYLNVPGVMYNDTQISSEYIAYAINYVSAITSTSSFANKLAVIPWSQGNPDTQWVFQYWPSTRSAVTDFISISADFDGTTLAYFLDPAFPDVVPNPPSIIQQEYDSNFIRTLRAGGGGSPYVPNTSIWSITDEIVQPQYDPYASAAYFTYDLPGSQPAPIYPSSSQRNVPYTNNQIQTACQGMPAGGVYPHEGVLYNPLAYALALDALRNVGPGQVSRLDLTTVCNQLIAPGLSLEDVIATEGLIPLAAMNLLLYPQKVLDEPPIMQYALAQGNNCDSSGNGGDGGEWNGQ